MHFNLLSCQSIRESGNTHTHIHAFTYLELLFEMNEIHSLYNNLINRVHLVHLVIQQQIQQILINNVANSMMRLVCRSDTHLILSSQGSIDGLTVCDSRRFCMFKYDRTD